MELRDMELRKLLDVGRTPVAQLDVETVLRHVLETDRELTGARYAALGILDERKETPSSAPPPECRPVRRLTRS